MNKLLPTFEEIKARFPQAQIRGASWSWPNGQTPAAYIDGVNFRDVQAVFIFADCSSYAYGAIVPFRKEVA